MFGLGQSKTATASLRYIKDGILSALAVRLEQLDLRGLLDSYNHWQKFPAGPARALLRALCLLFGAEVVPSDGHTGPRPKGSPDWVKTFCAVTGAPRMVSWLRRKSS